MSSKTPAGAPDIRLTARKQIRNKVLLSPEYLERYRELRDLHRRAAYHRRTSPSTSSVLNQPATDIPHGAVGIIDPCVARLQLDGLRESDQHLFLEAVADAARRTQEQLGRPVDPENQQHCIRLRREFLQALTAIRHAAVSDALDNAPFALQDRIREALFRNMEPRHRARGPRPCHLGARSAREGGVSLQPDPGPGDDLLRSAGHRRRARRPGRTTGSCRPGRKGSSTSQPPPSGQGRGSCPRRELGNPARRPARPDEDDQGRPVQRLIGVLTSCSRCTTAYVVSSSFTTSVSNTSSPSLTGRQRPWGLSAAADAITRSTAQTTSSG